VEKQKEKKMKKILEYLGSIVKSDSSDSSKRFIALSTMLFVFYAVIRYTAPDNYVTVLEILLGFVLILLGAAVWQDIRKTRIDKENTKEDSKG
jgi:hypothetical protein